VTATRRNAAGLRRRRSEFRNSRPRIAASPRGDASIDLRLSEFTRNVILSVPARENLMMARTAPGIFGSQGVWGEPGTLSLLRSSALAAYVGTVYRIRSGDRDSLPC
jgi:hypothetical protein